MSSPRTTEYDVLFLSDFFMIFIISGQLVPVTACTNVRHSRTQATGRATRCRGLALPLVDMLINSRFVLCEVAFRVPVTVFYLQLLFRRCKSFASSLHCFLLIARHVAQASVAS